MSFSTGCIQTPVYYIDSPGENKNLVQRHSWAIARQDWPYSRAKQCVLIHFRYYALSTFWTAGTIVLPSTILQFWDLGGQRGIRNIWHRYYGDCHAVVYVIDAEDRERLSEGWEVFGIYIYISWHFSNTQSTQFLYVDNVLSNPQILGVPLLLLANKQDSPLSLSVDDIRHDYEDWHQRKLESARRTRYGETDASVDMSARRERIASLDVMGISAIEGWASSFSFFAAEYIHDI